jgi:DNA-binding MarR family transcriptional regulator
MHPVIFGLKRAHQSTLRISRPVLKKMGLTPARFDMLCALMPREGAMTQGTLQRILGVTRATVSRMLGSLEELGFVGRERHDIDGRCKVVWLTDEGRARIVMAHKELVRSGWVQLAIDSALGEWWRGPCAAAIAELERPLRAIRRAFYDTGSLRYPTAPPKRAAAWQDGEGVV